MFAPAAIAVTRLIAMARRRARPGLADLTWVVPPPCTALVEVAVHFVVKGEFPLLANSSRNLTAPFTALVDALKYDVAHINTAHLSPIDIALLEYATLAIFILAGLAVLSSPPRPCTSAWRSSSSCSSSACCPARSGPARSATGARSSSPT